MTYPDGLRKSLASHSKRSADPASLGTVRVDISERNWNELVRKEFQSSLVAGVPLTIVPEPTQAQCHDVSHVLICIREIVLI
uniref:Uncharacterized protein n=1 Tax=Nelumbo nucifera TaxID=4432 RepID=A0A822XQK7_NELNU|nr:TPA_asm: hypothetical protein HUJ06_022904 [Nelumbo nucifera]